VHLENSQVNFHDFRESEWPVDKTCARNPVIEDDLISIYLDEWSILLIFKYFLIRSFVTSKSSEVGADGEELNFSRLEAQVPMYSTTYAVTLSRYSNLGHA